jgi:hypothetical protein
MLTADYAFDGTTQWEDGGMLMLAGDNQPIVDAYAIFRNCQLATATPGATKVFDLFIFDQSKLRHGAGLVPATYEKAAPWCRQIVSRYKAAHPDREAGFIFGVRNPLKPLSQQLRKTIDALSRPVDLEFFYALGRKECMAHYDFLSGHPALVKRVYINEKSLHPNLLALALPPSWSRPLQRAKAILERRPSNGYADWDEVIANAHLPGDKAAPTKARLGVRPEDMNINFKKDMMEMGYEPYLQNPNVTAFFVSFTLFLLLTSMTSCVANIPTVRFILMSSMYS